MLRRLGERREQLQPLTEMGNRFRIGGVLDGALTRLMPIVDCLLRETCLSVMIGYGSIR